MYEPYSIKVDTPERLLLQLHLGPKGWGNFLTLELPFIGGAVFIVIAIALQQYLAALCLLFFCAPLLLHTYISELEISKEGLTIKRTKFYLPGKGVIQHYPVSEIATVENRTYRRALGYSIKGYVFINIKEKWRMVPVLEIPLKYLSQKKLDTITETIAARLGVPVE